MEMLTMENKMSWILATPHIFHVARCAHSGRARLAPKAGATFALEHVCRMSNEAAGQAHRHHPIALADCINLWQFVLPKTLCALASFPPLARLLASFLLSQSEETKLISETRTRKMQPEVVYFVLLLRARLESCTRCLSRCHAQGFDVLINSIVAVDGLLKTLGPGLRVLTCQLFHKHEIVSRFLLRRW